MNLIIKWLIDVSFFVFILAGLAIWFRNKKCLRNLFLILASLWLFIIYISPIPLIITENWERSYPAFDINNHKNLVQDSTVYILVLGAGFENDSALSATSRLGNTVAIRLIEGLRIYRQLNNAKLVSSGAEINSTVSQADAVSKAAVELGVNPLDTLQLSNTINTEDEAYRFVRRFGKRYKVILATDAVHMKRAMQWFKYYGIDAIAAPCNYRVKNDPDFPDSRWKPRLNKIQMFNDVLKEWAGMRQLEIINDKL